MMTPYYPDMSEQDLTARLEMMAVLCEGTALRRLTYVHADSETLRTVYIQVFSRVFNDYPPAYTPEN
jgi:hypothetical protein